VLPQNAYLIKAIRRDANMETDFLLILTGADKVSINYKKPNQQELSHITVAEAIKYMNGGHFAPGSMLPKVLAAIKPAKALSRQESDYRITVQGSRRFGGKRRHYYHNGVTA
jgi:carbamate kinase